MRVTPVVTLPLFFVAIGCGGASTRTDVSMGAAGGSADAGPGGACSDPASAVPDVAPFQAPPVGALGAFQVTFHNRCAKTVWPAWGSAGGLDNSVIDTQLWLPMSPASDRTVTVYGGVRDIGFWGRTACGFDQGGGGTCQTGECGGFVCPIAANNFPLSATIFVLTRGFLGGYNVGLRVEGAACGNHECVAEVGTCSDASTVEDACGTTTACRDICSDSATQCCNGARSRCGAGQWDDTTDTGDLVITFCP